MKRYSTEVIQRIRNKSVSRIFQKRLNLLSEDGWTLHSWQWVPSDGSIIAVFEKDSGDAFARS